MKAMVLEAANSQFIKKEVPDPVAGPGPAPREIVPVQEEEDPSAPKAVAGPASQAPDTYKPGGVDRSVYDDRSMGGPLHALYTVPSVLAGASGASTLIN